jgi:hypothetical protein
MKKMGTATEGLVQQGFGNMAAEVLLGNICARLNWSK